uniref:Uncharacterized protein n=1 Tax=Pyxicephalus adspersus TaxID=30357 RepID=A0AAV3B064_PYXAD|nr:TPA: hypothetical protein GDO54_001328 [Pyxicephalus adspersus]
MEKYLKGLLPLESLPTVKRPIGSKVTCTATLHLFCSLTCLSVLFSSTDAAQTNPVTPQGRIHFGFGLRISNNIGSLMVANGPQSVHSCHEFCYQSQSCNVFWLLKNTCILADCRTPHHCQPTKMDSRDSLLVFLDKEQTAQTSPFHHLSDFLSHEAYWPKQSNRPRLKRGSLLRVKRQEGELSDPNHEKKQQIPVNPALQQDPPSKKGPKTLMNITSGNQKTELHASLMPSTLPLSESPLTTRPSASINTTNLLPSEALPDTGKEYPDTITSAPFLILGNASEHPTTAPTSTITTTPVTNKLVVSAGTSVEITLPKNEVQLDAFVVPEPPEGKVYTYDWRLITHPTDYSGEMEGKHTQSLKLSKLTAGLYEFKVIVDGDNAHGEGFVNVTVNPEPRVNRPPVAIVSPRYQEISLPTTSTVIDGSQSTDDEKIVSYHWEELKGPLREEKITGDTEILKLTNLVPGSYTFRLTVEDSDGARNSTTANLTVNKAVDYPPVANAGANQVITLPKNSIVLYGNLSTDDHGIVSYEWSLSPSSKGKVMEMQGVRTSTLQLSALQEGDYTFQLTVTDSAGQQSTSEVTVIVQPENNKPPQADAGPDKELTLPVDSTTLDGSRSTDDQKIASYLWEKTKGPEGVKIENDNSSIATVTGLQVGKYEFTLTVKDDRGLQDQATVSVVVKDEMNKPPVAKIAGNVVITLPTNTAELDGSKSSDDKGIVSYQWKRDESSPAAGEVLNTSDHHAVLFLSNLVEGTYTFHLKVTDAKGESDSDRATIEVKPDPMKNNLVEMILDVSVSQLTERQKGMFMRQIGVLLGVLDSDITVQNIQLYTEKSTKVVFYVKNQPPHLVMKGYQVACTLRNELRKQQSDFLIFRALEIDTFSKCVMDTFNQPFIYKEILL